MTIKTKTISIISYFDQIQQGAFMSLVIKPIMLVTDPLLPSASALCLAEHFLAESPLNRRKSTAACNRTKYKLINLTRAPIN